MCPVCGTPLNVAEEAPQAERQRAFIQREIDRCTKSQIKRALVAEFGEQVPALPGDESDDDLGDVLAYVISRWRSCSRRQRSGSAPRAGGGGWRPNGGGARHPASKRLDADMERYDL